MKVYGTIYRIMILLLGSYYIMLISKVYEHLC